MPKKLGSRIRIWFTRCRPTWSLLCGSDSEWIVVLVDTSATHNFVSNRTAMTLHSQTEFSKSAVVNSTMDLVAEMVHEMPMKVENWYSKMELAVAPLDYDSVVLGQNFLRLSKEIMVLFMSRLVFLSESKTWSV